MDDNGALVARHVTDVNGPVHFMEFGGAGPAIVLVHGLGGSAINWLGVGPALARRGRTIAVDLPGFGRTPLAGRSTRVAAQAEWLGRFIESVTPGPAVVVGNSMGGLIGMMAAAAEPALISHLVLAAPAAPAPRRRIHPAVLASFLIYSMPVVGAWYVERRSARLGAEGLVRDMLRMCCVDPSRVAAELRDAHVSLAAERLERMPWGPAAFLEAARSTVRAIARRRRFDEMTRKIAAPVLLIHGDRDRLVPLEAARRLSRVRPEWTLEVLDDVGHVAQMETPTRFVDAMTRWMDATPRTRASVGQRAPQHATARGAGQGSRGEASASRPRSR